MSFFFTMPAATAVRTTVGRELAPAPPGTEERLNQEIIAQRPALLDEKIKLHAKIIDEFNLANLEKMPHEELVKVVRNYVGEYARTEKIALNQRELQAFADDIVDEMRGFGPIE